MTDFFSIEYRKSCRKYLADKVYTFFNNSTISNKIWAFLIKMIHFLMPFVLILITLYASFSICVILMIITVLIFFMFNYLQGCFLSQVEYKLYNKDFINVVDIYLAILGWDINDETRKTITIYAVIVYHIIIFTILYIRFNIKINHLPSPTKINDLPLTIIPQIN
jgi:hypothetical protein